jgi:hypothetical protein
MAVGSETRSLSVLRGIDEGDILGLVNYSCFVSVGDGPPPPRNGIQLHRFTPAGAPTNEVGFWADTLGWPGEPGFARIDVAYGGGRHRGIVVRRPRRHVRAGAMRGDVAQEAEGPRLTAAFTAPTSERHGPLAAGAGVLHLVGEQIRLAEPLDAGGSGKPRSLRIHKRLRPVAARRRPPRYALTTRRRACHS